MVAGVKDGRGRRTAYRPQWETLKPASQFTDGETLKSGALNTEVSRQKTLKPASHETGKGNREETGKENPPTTEANLAPPAQPSKPPPARKKYAFEGTVIRLTVDDFETWASTYHGIPDIKAELTAIDAWCATNWPDGSKQRKGWFHRVSNMLNRKHQEVLAPESDSSGYWAEVAKGAIH